MRCPLSFPRCRAERERGRDFHSAVERFHQLCLEFSSPAPLPTCPIQSHRPLWESLKKWRAGLLTPSAPPLPNSISVPGSLEWNLSFLSGLALGTQFLLFLPLLWSLQSADPCPATSPPPAHRLGPPQPLSSTQGWPPCGLIGQNLPQSTSPLPGAMEGGGWGET